MVTAGVVPPPNHHGSFFAGIMVFSQNLTEINLTSAPKKALTVPVTLNSSEGWLMREAISDPRILPSPPCLGWNSPISTRSMPTFPRIPPLT